MTIKGDHIYATTESHDIIKMNKNGETREKILTKKLNIYCSFTGISIERSNIYTCENNSLTVGIFDLDLVPTDNIILKAISFNEDTTPRDIIVHKQQIFVLFGYRYYSDYHPDPIQVFELDGTLIRSLVTGNDIKNARYFCLDSCENILVSDYRGHCIRIFSPDGILIQKIGREGKKEAGELCYPRGITVDSKQRIIIVDEKDSNILQAF